MKKQIWWILLALLVVLGGIYWFKTQNLNQKVDSVQIGVILPLTGVSATLGKPILEAMQIAEKNVNDSLKVKGKKNIKLLFEDGKSDASGSISAFQKLQLNNPAAYIIFGDIPASDLANSFSKFKFPVITLGAAAENIPSLSEKYFRAWTPSLASSEKLSRFAKEKLNVKNCGILSVNINLGQEFSKNVNDVFTSLGGIVKIKETFELEDQDVKGQILKIIAQKPECVFILGFGPGYLAAFNQLREYGYKGLILTDETITIPSYIDAVSNAIDGTYFCATTFDPRDTLAISYNSLVKPFKNKFDYFPNAHSVFGYVSVTMLYDAILRHGDSSPGIETGLKNMKNFNSIIGPLSYTPNRELIVPVIIRQMKKDGTFHNINF